ncbi:MAG TPA: PTS system mannose/fructose/sorbose family transporter subunit IID [Longimicrobiales bacterium]
MRLHAPALSLSAPARIARAAVLLRSFAIQGSWNYRTLIGAGFGFALLPVLRARHRGDPAALREALERHTALFNSHPYLAPIALGAVVRLETAGEDAAIVERFKAAVRGPLGSLGDRLVWVGLRPVCLLFALALAFAGAPWWVPVLAFLLAYNAGHLFLRAWGYRLGLHEGRAVGERLRHSFIGPAQQVLAVAGAFLTGLLLPLAAAGEAFSGLLAQAERALPLPWMAAAVAAALLGLRFGGAVRLPIFLALAAFLLLGSLWRIIE